MKSRKSMTKKERKEDDKRRRTFWQINPVTRREDKNKWKGKRDKEREKINREDV